MKYKFKAIYKDGTEYLQNDQDISISNPQKSCFFDLKKEEIKLFFLTNPQNNSYISINLETLEFNVNGNNFFLHDVSKKISNVRLIYFRRNKVVFGPNSQVQSVTFNIGWQGNDETGQNIQKIITLY